MAEGELVAALAATASCALAGALQDGQRAGGRPERRGNDFARVLGIPMTPRGSRAWRSKGASGWWTSATCNDPFVGIASFGFDSDANRIANETKLVKGNLVYLLRRAARAGRLEAGALHGHRRRRAHELTGYSVAVGNSKAYGGGMSSLPQAELDDGRLDVMLAKDDARS